MALKDLIFTKHEIKTVAGSFDVQGLSYADISKLIEFHMEDMQKIFEEGLNLQTILKDFPTLCYSFIALGSGDHSIQSIQVAATMPFGIQQDALMKIWELSALEPKKLGELFQSILKGIELMTLNLNQVNDKLLTKS